MAGIPEYPVMMVLFANDTSCVTRGSQEPNKRWSGCQTVATCTNWLPSCCAVLLQSTAQQWRVSFVCDTCTNHFATYVLSPVEKNSLFAHFILLLENHLDVQTVIERTWQPFSAYFNLSEATSATKQQLKPVTVTKDGQKIPYALLLE